VSEDGAGEFGEEALDEVESGAMLKREGEGETSARSSSEPSFGFSRDVCGMIVEDQLDSGVGRISGVEKLEEFDELAAAVAVADECMDLAIEQVDPSQQSDASIRSRNWAQPSAPGYWSFRIVPGAWRCGSHRCHFEPAASRHCPPQPALPPPLSAIAHLAQPPIQGCERARLDCSSRLDRATYPDRRIAQAITLVFAKFTEMQFPLFEMNTGGRRDSDARFPYCPRWLLKRERFRARIKKWQKRQQRSGECTRRLCLRISS
jgi:hypothetical protein